MRAYRARVFGCFVRRRDNRSGMDFFSGGGDPERQANIAFALIFLGIIFVGGLTIWLFYGATF